jgi:membrane protein DedA with SNARE-associated domain
MFGVSVHSLLTYALHHPGLQAGAIILATFILEDAATVLAAIQAASGDISIPLALGALYAGIVLGDAGLYGLGALGRFIPFIDRLLPPRRAEMVRAWMDGRVFKIVVISRFLPGVRLPTYTSCGYLGVSFRKFIFASMAATVVWTSGLFLVSMKVGDFILAHFGVWRWAGVLGMIVFMVAAGRFASRIWKEHPED